MALTVAEVAQRIGTSPRVISTGLYLGWFPFDAPVISGRRMVPDDQVERIADIIRERSKVGSRMMGMPQGFVGQPIG